MKSLKNSNVIARNKRYLLPIQKNTIKIEVKYDIFICILIINLTDI
jgi:hypothetical protein